MSILIRSELPADYDSISRVHQLAFGGHEEAQLVESIRYQPGFDPQLSLVATPDGELIGHILFSPIRIETLQATVPVLALAPMAVLPEFQRQGIGTALIKQGLKACRRAGHRVVIVVGHAAYYPRFGFLPASQFGIEAPFDIADESFMVLALDDDMDLVALTGVVRYPGVFGLG